MPTELSNGRTRDGKGGHGRGQRADTAGIVEEARKQGGGGTPPLSRDIPPPWLSPALRAKVHDSMRCDFSSCLRAYSAVITSFFVPREGASNCASIMMASMMLRNPRAPSLYSMALSTT